MRLVLGDGEIAEAYDEGMDRELIYSVEEGHWSWQSLDGSVIKDVG